MAKFKNINWKSKKTWKNALVIGLACITIIGAFVGLSSLFRKSEETTREITPTYAIGGLTEQGTYKETKESIYTEDAFECQGLDVTLDFRSTISYRVYFYDSDSRFINSTSAIDSNYDDYSMPLHAKYCRIVITPNDDQEIKWHEKNNYSKQLTIAVDKEQQMKYDNNLAKADVTMINSVYNVDSATASQVVVDNNSPGYVAFDFVDVKGASELVFAVPNAVKDRTHLGIFTNEDKTGVVSFLLTKNLTPEIVGDYCVYTIEIPQDASYFTIGGIYENVMEYYIGLV